MNVDSVVRLDLTAWVDDGYLHTWMHDRAVHHCYHQVGQIGTTETLLVDIGDARDVTWDRRLLELFEQASSVTVIGSHVRGVMVATTLLRGSATSAEDFWSAS